MPSYTSIVRMAAIAAATTCISACMFNDPTLQETLGLELAVPAGSNFVITAGTGKLMLEGDEGDSIRVEAEIYQTVPSQDYRLILEPDGEDGVRLIAESTAANFGMGDYIDLSVRVPHTLNIRIHDGSGSMQIRNLSNNLNIEDDSGSLTIVSVGGDLNVDDSSGSMSIKQIGGDVMIDDGSGSITVIDVGGTVTVSDGSGSITVRNAQDFELLDDGSGSVNLDGIRNSSG